MSHIATVRTRGGDYKSSTSKGQTRPQDDREFHIHSTQTTHNSTINTPVPTESHNKMISRRIVRSILGPVG